MRKMKWSMTALLICLLYGSTLPGNTDDWPMFQHDPQHSGYSSSPMPESLGEVWTTVNHCRLNGGRTLALAVSENRIFVVDLMCLSVLDVNTGSVIWSMQMTKLFSNSPAIENNRLFLFDPGVIFCFNADTGEELWRVSVKSLGINSSPLALDKFVIIEGDYKIVCLDAETNKIVWEFYLDDYFSFSPAYFEGRVYTNDGSNHIYCLDVQTGDLIWKKRIEWNNSSHLSLDGERIYVGTTGGILCLKSETGEIIWRFECDNIISEPPAVAYKKVFAGDRKGILYCLNAETGELIWKMDTGSTISSPIIVADKKVAFGTDDGTLYLVKAESGRICESLDFESGITGLALSDGKLFIGQHNGRVSCYEGSASKNLIPVVFILILSVVLILISVWYHEKS
jgi:outer membrane protein assembly factor BamB